MVVGVEEDIVRDSGFESEEFIVPEFGRVNLGWLDFSRKYSGAVFRLGQDVCKQISDIVGFTANFDSPGIRAACIDLFKTEGYCVFEIERNTKPTDLAVRYSRERWNLLDATGKTRDTLRPWIKTEYRAKYITEKITSLIAEQLKMRPDSAANFIFRINFKEKTFAVIGEECFADKMPAGGFSHFSLPTEAMIALAKRYGKITENSEELTADQRKNEATVGASAQDSEEPISEEAIGTPAQSFLTAAESKIESSLESQAVQASLKDTQPLPGSTKSLEKFIQRKADKPMEKTEQGREPVESTSAKYATYSRSEVDYMLKQQTENITSALGSKISSQQRVFQEAVEKQEKSFAKLSDKFVFDFDQTRIRLENSSKQSEESISTQLDSFKRDLSKELEQYRAQINKTVVPVAKFIEDNNNKAPDKAQKEVSQAKARQAQPAPQADNNGLRAMLIGILVIAAAILAAVLFIVMPALTKIDELQLKLNELNSKMNSSYAPPAQTTSNTRASESKAGIGENSQSASTHGSNSLAK